MKNFNSVNVYWSCLENEWMLAEKPESVLDNFYKKNIFFKNEPLSLINKCPSFNDSLKNVFLIKSIYDYDINYDGNGLFFSQQKNQTFFDNHVTVRSEKNMFLSFSQKYVFFSDENSLPVTFYEHPFLENNFISNNCSIVTGKFDIGKWLRNTEFSFYVKNDKKHFSVKNGDVMYYLRFHTEKKINFIQFRFTEKLNRYIDDGNFLFIQKLGKLENYYSKFKNKKIILKEIKENIV